MKNREYVHIVHPIPPLYDENSRILILGSFPSVKSREANFFYGHPQNRFWPLMARIFERPPFRFVEEKREFALSHGIAMWDVIFSCDIVGSSDSSIKNAEPSDLLSIKETGDLLAVITNGRTSGKMYDKYQKNVLGMESLTLPSMYGKYQKNVLGMESLTLPSTSPANAAWSFERLYAEWKIVREILEAGTRKQS